MKKTDIDRFFKLLSQKTKEPLKIYLTGGVAAWLMGGNRPTEDIDFSLQNFHSPWEKVEQLIREVSQQTGIFVEFSEDISRWGMIGYPKFIKEASLYNKFGTIYVYYLEPTIWSVGKISRYTADDISDMEIVFRKKKIKPEKLLKTWAIALHESPPSSEKRLFIKKIADFLKNSGPKIWGANFNIEKSIQTFNKLIKLQDGK